MDKSPRFTATERLIQKIPRIGLVVDVGCGNNPRKFHADNYIGLDVDSKLLAEISKDISDVNLICASGCEMPFKDNSFDTIICTEVLEHLDKPEDAISEFRRVLKKGGFGIISVPSLSFPQTVVLWIAYKTNRISKFPYQSSQHKREYARFNVSPHFEKAQTLFNTFGQSGLDVKEVNAVQPLLTRPKILYKILRKIEPYLNKFFSIIQIGHYMIFEVERVTDDLKIHKL